jgi:hypothetical protein
LKGEIKQETTSELKASQSDKSTGSMPSLRGESRHETNSEFKTPQSSTSTSGLDTFPSLRGEKRQETEKTEAKAEVSVKTATSETQTEAVEQKSTKCIGVNTSKTLTASEIAQASQVSPVASNNNNNNASTSTQETANQNKPFETPAKSTTKEEKGSSKGETPQSASTEEKKKGKGKNAKRANLTPKKRDLSANTPSPAQEQRTKLRHVERPNKQDQDDGDDSEGGVDYSDDPSRKVPVIVHKIETGELFRQPKSS